MANEDGYEYWEIDDSTYPYPLDEINVSVASETFAGASCRLRFPRAIPFDKTEAQSSVGIVDGWKLTFSLRSERGAGGRVENHAFCTAKHVGWFESHGETGPGGIQTFRVGQADFKNKAQTITKDCEHGPHFDRAQLVYSLQPNGEADLSFTVWHQTWGKIGEADQPLITPGPSTAPPRDSGPKDPPPKPAPEKPTPDPIG